MPINCLENLNYRDVQSAWSSMTRSGNNFSTMLNLNEIAGQLLSTLRDPTQSAKSSSPLTSFSIALTYTIPFSRSKKTFFVASESSSSKDPASTIPLASAPAPFLISFHELFFPSIDNHASKGTSSPVTAIGTQIPSRKLIPPSIPVNRIFVGFFDSIFIEGELEEMNNKIRLR